MDFGIEVVCIEYDEDVVVVVFGVDDDCLCLFDVCFE